MTTQKSDELGFPKRLFTVGTEPKFKKSINYHCKPEWLEEVSFAVGEEVWNKIRDSALGVVVNFTDNKFTWSSKVVEYILQKQLVCTRKHEIWCLYGNVPARFSLSEFEAITTLNCSPFPDENELDVSTNTGKDLFWQKLKLKGKSPCKKDLKAVCGEVASWSTEEKTRFAYLSIVLVILGYDDKVQLSHSIANMVFDLELFEKYPWGRLAFKELIDSIKSVVYTASSCTIHGFIQTLQVWAYYVVPNLGAITGRPSLVDCPLLLKYRGTKGKKSVDIHTIVLQNESNLTPLMNDLEPAVWDNERTDKKIDVLIKAIMKDGGLGSVIWVDEGLYSLVDDIHDDSGNGLEEANIVKESSQKNKQVQKMGVEKKKSVGSGFNFLNDKVEELQAKNNALEDELDDMRKKMNQFEAMQTRIAFLEEEVKKKDYETTLLRINFLEEEAKKKDYSELLLRIEMLEKNLSSSRMKPKTAQDFSIPSLRDEDLGDVPTSANLADLRGAKTDFKKLISSDDESTESGSYPTTKRYEDLSQKSSNVKIFEPNSSSGKLSEKSMNAIKAMFKEDNDKHIRGKSTRVTKPGPSLVTPYKVYDPAIGITNKRLKITAGIQYNAFAPVDPQKTKALNDWLLLKLDYPTGSGHKGEDFFNVLRKPQGWLISLHTECAMNMLRLRFMKNPSMFRSRRIAFLDAYFTAFWCSKYKEFLGSKEVQVFPNGSRQYANGEFPEFAKTGLSWRTDVDDIYCVQNVGGNHWVALVISIPSRSVDVLDCGFNGTSNEGIFAAVKPIAHMLPHLLRAAAPESERGSMSVEKYKIRRPHRGIPQMLKVGDCGIYAIKFIECHALGVPFKTPISDSNIKIVREKLASEIFDELKY